MVYSRRFYPEQKIPKEQKNVPCPKCKKDSLWTNEEIAKIKVDKDIMLRCGACGKKCIRLMPTGLIITVDDLK